MCIACELGYWSMVDAIEAERGASKTKAAHADDASGFACETPAEQPERKPGSRAKKAADERAP
jgi:hypothetical protein